MSPGLAAQYARDDCLVYTEGTGYAVLAFAFCVPLKDGRYISPGKLHNVMSSTPTRSALAQHIARVLTHCSFDKVVGVLARRVVTGMQ